MTAPAASIAFVLKGYPRLSETFIAQEILSLERRGLDIRLISLRHPTDARIHPVHREIKAKVSYLPEYLYREPLRVYRAWLKVRKRPGYPAARALWLRDLPRDPTPNRIRRFGQALVLAAELPEDVTHIHAHFLHTPASVARYAARILGLGWSCSAHAKDIWTTPEWEKREKLADCQWLVTCTRLNADHLRNLAADPDKVDLVYHGLDLSRFPPPAADPSGRNGRSPTDPVRILSVGRVVEKKGYPLLLKALARLPDDLCWRFVHVGGGKGLARLRKLADRLGLGDRVSWKGALPQEEVIDQYRKADLFVLNCRIADDGDRDGLPNVLMEAQAMGLPCLSTAVSAIPELIENGTTGVLVQPDDEASLATALENLITSPEKRTVLGKAGREKVHQAFSHDGGLDRLTRRFGLDEQRSG